MENFNRVKIQNFVETQIPEFINEDNPLFKEFLEQYYSSVEYPTGTVDLATNLNEYKSIDFFNRETFYTEKVEPCRLISNVQAFDSTINVNHTIGFPSKYGLLKIDNEIITYLSKTDTTFEDCVRGFCGIDRIADSKYLDLIFNKTTAEFHSSESNVENLNIKFFDEFFRKFKYQFSPGFENREFSKKLNIQSLLLRIKDFYKSKGTEESYKILFKILYNSDVDIISPQEYMLRPSDNKYFITNNILVEKIIGDIDPLTLKGNTIFQSIPSGIAVGEIYNVEFRPVDGKELYEISLDPEKNILKFISTKNTYILEDINRNSNVITVDSTVGFPDSGTLYIKSKNIPSPFTISYQDKTINQFLGVSGILVDLSTNDVVIEPNFAYVETEDGRVDFRVINIIEDIDFSNTSNLRISDIIGLSSFGANLNSSKKFSEWLYNIPTIHKIKSVNSTSNSNIWRIELYDSVKFILDEKISVKDTNNINSSEIPATINNVINNNTILIATSQNISTATELSKKISKVISENYPEIISSSSNIQNTYIDDEEEFAYVASTGLPDYKIFANDRGVLVSTRNPTEEEIIAGTASTTILNTNINHNFYTGEKIYFTPNGDVGISSGAYYVHTIGSINTSKRISLTYSNSDLFTNEFIELPLGIHGTIVKLDYENARLKNQKLLKKFPLVPTNNRSSISKSTNNRPIGMLVNGVELYSTTLFDENIYYGKLDKIQIINRGTGYDVINPPELNIEDMTGTGAKAHLNISGYLKEIKVIDPGYGYDKNIRISITGGNGDNAELVPNINREKITSAFVGDFEGVNPNENTIEFIRPHNFEDGELIQYLPSGNEEIDYFDPITNENKKLSSDSFYYAGLVLNNDGGVSETKIKLYTNQDDVVKKVNEINLIPVISNSSGIHYFRTSESKFIISNIFIKNPGSNYSNKKVIIPPTESINDDINGVNLFDDYIYAKSHNFNDKDLIVYNTSGQSIGGLVKGTKYYVKVIDENRFKLTFAGSNNINDENYIKERYVRFTSFGNRSHTFSYPPIEIKIEAYPETSEVRYKLPVLEPIITGEIESVFLESGGSTYGANNIINYHRRPNIGIKGVSSEAVFRPIVIDGRIVSVQILSSGRGYTEDIDIIVDGSGKFADLYPIVENGRVVSINIINTGIGYGENTSVRIKRRGSGASFLGSVYEWKINQVEKNLKILIRDDEGILAPAIKEAPELQFVHFYPPRILRKKLKDNITNDDKEQLFPIESPILGWSYDGFPIYGPYSSVNGTIKQLRSGYELSPETSQTLRPPRNIFPPGFFIQDYKFNPLNIDGLDKYNGKYIANSDFPEGTYAYFYTININTDGTSTPEYPYLIGEQFKIAPIEENYNPNYNQNIDIAKLGLVRNTSPYYLNSNNSYYSSIDTVDSKYKQEFIVNTISSSNINSVDLYTGGDGYRVGELLNFDNSNTSGGSANGSILSVSGKPILSINVDEVRYQNITFYKKRSEIIGVSTGPLDIQTGDYISISNIDDINYKSLEGTHRINTYSKTVGLSSDISPSQSGSITSILPNDVVGLEVDDFIKIDEEIAKILQIFPEQNKLVIHRISNVGLHTAGISTIELLPRKFSFFVSDLDLISRENINVYFNPSEVISVGTTSKQYVLDSQTSIAIPERSIYIKNHGYITKQPLVYTSGIDGTPLLVSNTPEGPNFSLNDGQIVYAVNNGPNYIGLTTGIGTEFPQLYFSDEEFNFGMAHSLTTTFAEVFGDVENYSVSILTREPHQLIIGDKIQLNLTPEITNTVKFRYDSILKKITTEKIDFNALEINLNNSEIKIETNEIKTGDKVVYYSNDNQLIGGLTNNSTYFAIKTTEEHIKLALYYSDAIEGEFIKLTSIGDGIQSLAKINPKISIINGNTVIFDLTDDSLNETYLKLYSDNNFTNELKTYDYILPDGRLYIGTKLLENNKDIYYSFTSSENKIITIDSEVKYHNTIEVLISDYNNEYEVIVIDNDRFKFNLQGKPEDIEYTENNLSTLNYTTKSTNVSGPIDSIKLNYGGKGYKKLPKVNVITKNGNGALLKTKSDKVGRISSVERVKDGFDYPSDATLLPVLSVPAIVQVEDISRVDYVGIITSGRNYNTAPSLKVIGNSRIKLEAVLDGKSVVEVKIIENTNDLSGPLEIIPIRNSNGYSIDEIVVNGFNVTLELLNSDIDNYPLIVNEYGSTDFVFPFEIGDQIFIERCRVLSEDVDDNGEIIIKDNFNSSNYGYKFFTVTGISTENYTVTYSMEGVKSDLQLGEYTAEFGYGYVVNKKDMADFEMFVINDLSYISEETVLGYDESGTNTFTAKVMKDGWDNDINELRLIDVQGNLKVGNKLEGLQSRLNGTVTNVNIFNLKSKMGVTRNKLNDLGDRIGFLNDYYQRISDNDYYQKFSYSIKGEIPYNIWKEPVGSIIHPSGFKEFSDLVVYNKAQDKLRTSTSSSLDLTINIDSVESFYTNNNFGMVTEDEQFEDGSIERVIFDEGVVLKPYISLKSNKVSEIDSISSEFDGTATLEVIANKPVQFISTDLYKLGVSTEGLNIGDKIGFSTYHFYPDSTYIFNIGENYIELNPDTPHRLYSNNGTSVSVVENLDFYRRVPGSKIVGKTEFNLTSRGVPLFYREFDSSDEILIERSIFNLPNHNFQTGQELFYDSKEEPAVAIAITDVGSGAILIPIFDDNYSVSNIKIISGGSGYDYQSPPKIEILNAETPHIEAEFSVLVDPTSSSIVNVSVANSGLGYFPLQLNAIGIETSSQVEVRRDIIMEVGGGIGSAIYERGYNVAISTSIIGESASLEPNFSGNQNVFWGFSSPYIPAKDSSGIGIDAKFSIFIVYNSSTGQPISTSIVLRDGGRGYSIGDTVSIAGTYLGGSTPENDLSFVVSRISSTRIESESNKIYSNVPADTLVGYGSNAVFNVYRGDSGDISGVEVVSGGDNYDLEDNISIAGTYIGGITPNDNLLLSPTLLGVDKLPSKLYVRKININEFQVFGTLANSNPLSIKSSGVGTHSFELLDQNVNTMITIDNIIQAPLHRRNLIFNLDTPIKYNDTIIYLTQDVYKLKLNDILKINNELLIVKNTRVDGNNSVLVKRGTLGTEKDVHSEENIVYVFGGNYNIIKDKIYFTTAPYGPTGLPGLEVSSSFSGRAFSRRFDPSYENDKNIILDDVSEEFTGTGTTEFIIKSNGESVVGLYTNTNSITGTVSGENISNNPIILLNNIPQIGEVDYTIDTIGENKLKFLGGTPVSGKIISVSVLNNGFGYLPLVGASATVSVSSSGQIDEVYLNGAGSGYREPPMMSIVSNQGSGATLEAILGQNGTISSINIISSGSGYSTVSLPEVKIDEPQNYYNLNLTYANGYSGDGDGATGSLVISNDSSVKTFVLESLGKGYRVGEVLVASGIMTNPQSTSFEEFKVVVEEIFTDSITGWYPGQFIQFNDISNRFNGFRRRFNLTVNISGKDEVINLKALDPTDIEIRNNLFVFINDILQVPNESYTFSGSRIIFREAPKANSKCNILFFRGSDLDVELIDPLITIKEGDSIRIDANRFNPFDIPQFERIVKNVVSMDILDTFPYDSIGINVDLNRIRPLHWTKQTKDAIINGVLYSKSRPNLKSRITPIAKVIKSISTTDEKIYVDSAIPLFEDIDEIRGVGEENRDIVIVDNYDDFIYPKLKVNVGYAGTISSIDITDPGSGYKLNVNPSVSISPKFVVRKDPIFKWNSVSGITTNARLNSINYGNQFISVGSSGNVYFSNNGKDWSFSSIINKNYDFNDVIGDNNNYIAVGNSASVYKSFGISVNSIWEQIQLLDIELTVGNPIINPSDYAKNFNKCLYDKDKNTLLVVGEDGAIFFGTGSNPDEIYRYLPIDNNIDFDINSVASSGDYFVIVGNSGNIFYYRFNASNIVWQKSNFISSVHLNDIIWDGEKFVAVGDESTIITSTTGQFWNVIPPIGISENITKIEYRNGIYTIIDSSGKLYFSIDLAQWKYRPTLEDNLIDIISVGDENEELYISVGVSSFISYSTPVVNRASAVTTATNGQLSSVSIVNEGFGYSLTEDILTIVEDEDINTEKIFSIKAKGDFGTITNIEVFPTGNSGFGTLSPAIEFTLQSENYQTTILPNMDYSPIQKGDLFIISDSNVVCGHALTGITTSLGGMANYPNSKIGTATTFIDGIYMAENVITEIETGISTVRCFFVPVPAIGADRINVDIGINTTGFYGNYSFGVIYDYQNRAVESPSSFVVNSDDGLVGLNSGPILYRTRAVK